MTAATPTLQPYLPRMVMDWQRSVPDALAREIKGSMVLVDVSGFTTMSERLARHGNVGAEEVADVIGDTFETLLAEAYAYGGSLVKFGGDALLLFFSGDGHALRAAAAAHGMRARLRRIGTFTTTAGKVTLRMSAGAHAGVFHFFLVGGSHRELIVAGPAATETVAMEAAASAGGILLSPALAAALPAANRGRAVAPGVPEHGGRVCRFDQGELAGTRVVVAERHRHEAQPVAQVVVVPERGGVLARRGERPGDLLDDVCPAQSPACPPSATTVGVTPRPDGAPPSTAPAGSTANTRPAASARRTTMPAVPQAPREASFFPPRTTSAVPSISTMNSRPRSPCLARVAP